jgi:hypothetical protein
VAAIAKELLACAGDAQPRPHAYSYWLAEGAVLAGRHPGAFGAAAIRAAGVTHFVDLTAPGEPVDRYDASPAEHLQHPITDFGIPTVDGMNATLADIESAVASGGMVYLHCRAGIGRTGTVAACLLVNQGYGADEALDLLQQKWRVAAQRTFSPHTPETEGQRQFIRQWASLRSASGP